MREKDKIIALTLQYLQDKDNKLKNDILEKLEKMAKQYHIKIRVKNFRYDIRQQLILFISNEGGYMETIENLYNSIKND